MLMVGSLGAGKTLLARALPGILPEMSIEESVYVTRIYSVADQLPAGTPLIRHRPFRARITPFPVRDLSAAETFPSPEKSPLPIAAFYFSMSSPNLVRESSK
jgi:magnesium chelatase family protein